MIIQFDKVETFQSLANKLVSSHQASFVRHHAYTLDNIFPNQNRGVPTPSFRVRRIPLLVLAPVIIMNIRDFVLYLCHIVQLKLEVAQTPC